MNTSLKRNAILNLLKQSCTVVFPFITFTYSTHILGAENMGIFSFSQTVVSFFTLLATMGLSDYAVRECATFTNQSLYNYNFFFGFIVRFIVSTKTGYI